MEQKGVAGSSGLPGVCGVGEAWPGLDASVSFRIDVQDPSAFGRAGHGSGSSFQQLLGGAAIRIFEFQLHLVVRVRRQIEDRAGQEVAVGHGLGPPPDAFVADAFRNHRLVHDVAVVAAVLDAQEIQGRTPIRITRFPVRDLDAAVLVRVSLDPPGDAQAAQGCRDLRLAGYGGGWGASAALALMFPSHGQCREKRRH